MNSKIILKLQMKFFAGSFCFEGFNSCVHHCVYFAYRLEKQAMTPVQEKHLSSIKTFYMRFMILQFLL